jgi:hypothetical protein
VQKLNIPVQVALARLLAVASPADTEECLTEAKNSTVSIRRLESEETQCAEKVLLASSS